MNYLTVTKNVTVTVGNMTESFAINDEVSPYSVYADVLLRHGSAVDSGNPAPENDPEELYYSERKDIVKSVFYGQDPNKMRPDAQVVVWVGDLSVVPVNAYTTDIVTGEIVP